MQLKPRTIGFLLVPVMLLIASSCSSSDGQLETRKVDLTTATTGAASTATTEPTTTTSAKASSTTVAENELSEVARQYFTAIGGDLDARESAESGSVAYAYATYLRAAREAFNPPPTNETNFDPLGVELVLEGDQRVRYDNVVASQGGVASFDINGTPISDLLLFNSRPQGDAAITTEFLSAYRTAAGSFIVTVQIRNNAETSLEVAAYDAVWVSQDGGTQLEAAGWGGADSVRPGAVGTVVLSFGNTPVATSAGTVYFESFLDDIETAVSFSASIDE